MISMYRPCEPGPLNATLVARGSDSPWPPGPQTLAALQHHSYPGSGNWKSDGASGRPNGRTIPARALQGFLFSRIAWERTVEGTPLEPRRPLSSSQGGYKSQRFWPVPAEPAQGRTAHSHGGARVVGVSIVVLGLHNWAGFFTWTGTSKITPVRYRSKPSPWRRAKNQGTGF